MKKLYFIIPILTACFEQETQMQEKNYNIAMYGDSLCSDFRIGDNYHEFMDVVDRDCVGGRSLMRFPDLDTDLDLLFLAGGTNDTRLPTRLDFFEQKVMEYTMQTDVDIVCILPNTPLPVRFSDVTPYRDILISYCPDYIDPVPDCGLTVDNPDGVHYTQSQYAIFSDCIINKLQDKGYY